MAKTSPLGPESVFPFLVGCGRSGTTLFGLIFDSHPQVAIAHEAHFVADLPQRRPGLLRPGGFSIPGFVDGVYANPNFRRLEVPRPEVEAELASEGVSDYSNAVRAVFRVLARGRAKTLYGDKTPGYVTQMPLLARLFPEAKFVHIIRDGRDVALAYVDRPEWGPRTVGEAAWNWRSRVSRAMADGAKLGPERYLEVRYEALLGSPEETVGAVCRFLGIPFAPEMMEYQQRSTSLARQAGTPEAFNSLSRPLTSGLRHWRSQMEQTDLALFEAVAGSLLTELGYPLSGRSPTVGSRLAAIGSGLGWLGKRLTSRFRLGQKSRRSRLGEGKSRS